MRNSWRRRWPGLLRTCWARWCVFARMLEDCWYAFCQNKFFFCVGFFPCVCSSFFGFVLANLVVYFFCLFLFCILLHVWICVVYNQLLIYLLAGLIFVFVCTFACLPYFLQWFVCVLKCFFLPSWSNAHALFFAWSDYFHFLDWATCVYSKLLFLGTVVFNGYILRLLEINLPYC